MIEEARRRRVVHGPPHSFGYMRHSGKDRLGPGGKEYAWEGPDGKVLYSSREEVEVLSVVTDKPAPRWPIKPRVRGRVWPWQRKVAG